MLFILSDLAKISGVFRGQANITIICYSFDRVYIRLMRLHIVKDIFLSERYKVDTSTKNKFAV